MTAEEFAASEAFLHDKIYSTIASDWDAVVPINASLTSTYGDAMSKDSIAEHWLRSCERYRVPLSTGQMLFDELQVNRERAATSAQQKSSKGVDRIERLLEQIHNLRTNKVFSSRHMYETFSRAVSNNGNLSANWTNDQEYMTLNASVLKSLGRRNTLPKMAAVYALVQSMRHVHSPKGGHAVSSSSGTHDDTIMTTTTTASGSGGSSSSSANASTGSLALTYEDALRRLRKLGYITSTSLSTTAPTAPATNPNSAVNPDVDTDSRQRTCVSPGTRLLIEIHNACAPLFDILIPKQDVPKIASSTNTSSGPIPSGSVNPNAGRVPTQWVFPSKEFLPNSLATELVI